MLIFTELLVLTKTYIFNKLINITLFFILVLVLFGSFDDRSEWYIELYTKDNVTVKVPRNEYLEFKELWNVDNYSENQTKNYYRLLYNESIYYTENYQFYYVDSLSEL